MAAEVLLSNICAKFNSSNSIELLCKKSATSPSRKTLYDIIPNRMDIKIDNKEIIPFEDFDLGWRFSKSHNSDISEEELKQILPLSERESKRLNKVIDFYEIESNRIFNYQQTDWFRSSQENDEKIENFRSNLTHKLSKFDEDLIISWNRRTTLKTNKTIFLKYWTDFLYPSSDDVTIISEKTNWILFFSHYEVSNLWIKKQ